MHRKLTCISILIFAFPAMARAADNIICPPMPPAATPIIHDVQMAIHADAGALGRMKAAELEAKGTSVAHSIYDKYPQISQDMLAQTMGATYCSMLKSSKLSIDEVSERWYVFAARVLKLPADFQSLPASSSTHPATNRASENPQKTSVSSRERNHTSTTKSVESLSSDVRFQVGSSLLDGRSTTYLRAIAAKLRNFDHVVIWLEPIQSQSLVGDEPAKDATVLYRSRQQRVRQVLMQSGFPSDQIVFVTDMTIEGSSEIIYDASDRPIESGLRVDIRGVPN